MSGGRLKREYPSLDRRKRPTAPSGFQTLNSLHKNKRPKDFSSVEKSSRESSSSNSTPNTIPIPISTPLKELYNNKGSSSATIDAEGPLSNPHSRAISPNDFGNDDFFQNKDPFNKANSPKHFIYTSHRDPGQRRAKKANTINTVFLQQIPIIESGLHVEPFLKLKVRSIDHNGNILKQEVDGELALNISSNFQFIFFTRESMIIDKLVIEKIKNLESLKFSSSNRSLLIELKKENGFIYAKYLDDDTQLANFFSQQRQWGVQPKPRVSNDDLLARIKNLTRLRQVNKLKHPFPQDFPSLPSLHSGPITRSNANKSATLTHENPDGSVSVMDPNDPEAKDGGIIYPTEKPASFDPELKHKFSHNKEFIITYSDFKTLYNNDWINDSVIDFFIKYEIEKAVYESHLFRDEEIYAFNSFFFTKLMSKPEGQETADYYGNIKRWLSKLDLLSYPYVILPINENLHWYGCVIKGLPNLLKNPSVNEPNIGTKSETEKKVDEIDQTISMNLPSSQSSNHPSGCTSTEISSSPENKKLEGGSNELVANPDTRSEDNEAPSEELELDAPDTPSDDKTSDPDFKKESKKTPKSNTSSSQKKIPAVEIYVFDSLNQGHGNIVSPLKTFIIDYCKDKHGIKVETDDIKLLLARVPKQNNFNDCGIHVIYNVRKWLNNPAECQRIWRTKNKHQMHHFFRASERSVMRKELIDTLLQLHDLQDIQRKEKNEGPDVAINENKDHSDDEIVVIEYKPGSSTEPAKVSPDKPKETSLGESNTRSPSPNVDETAKTAPVSSTKKEKKDSVGEPNTKKPSLDSKIEGETVPPRKPNSLKDQKLTKSKDNLSPKPVDKALASTRINTPTRANDGIAKTVTLPYASSKNLKNKTLRELFANQEMRGSTISTLNRVFNQKVSPLNSNQVDLTIDLKRFLEFNKNPDQVERKIRHFQATYEVLSKGNNSSANSRPMDKSLVIHDQDEINDDLNKSVNNLKISSSSPRSAKKALASNKAKREEVVNELKGSTDTFPLGVKGKVSHEKDKENINISKATKSQKSADQAPTQSAQDISQQMEVDSSGSFEFQPRIDAAQGSRDVTMKDTSDIDTTATKLEADSKPSSGSDEAGQAPAQATSEPKQHHSNSPIGSRHQTLDESTPLKKAFLEKSQFKFGFTNSTLESGKVMTRSESKAIKGSEPHLEKLTKSNLHDASASASPGDHISKAASAVHTSEKASPPEVGLRRSNRSSRNNLLSATETMAKQKRGIQRSPESEEKYTTNKGNNDNHTAHRRNETGQTISLSQTKPKEKDPMVVNVDEQEVTILQEQRPGIRKEPKSSSQSISSRKEASSEHDTYPRHTFKIEDRDALMPPNTIPDKDSDKEPDENSISAIEDFIKSKFAEQLDPKEAGKSATDIIGQSAPIFEGSSVSAYNPGSNVKPVITTTKKSGLKDASVDDLEIIEVPYSKEPVNTTKVSDFSLDKNKAQLPLAYADLTRLGRQRRQPKSSIAHNPSPKESFSVNNSIDSPPEANTAKPIPRSIDLNRPGRLRREVKSDGVSKDANNNAAVDAKTTPAKRKVSDESTSHAVIALESTPVEAEIREESPNVPAGPTESQKIEEVSDSDSVEEVNGEALSSRLDPGLPQRGDHKSFDEGESHPFVETRRGPGRGRTWVEYLSGKKYVSIPKPKESHDTASHDTVSRVAISQVIGQKDSGSEAEAEYNTKAEVDKKPRPQGKPHRGRPRKQAADSEEDDKPATVDHGKVHRKRAPHSEKPKPIRLGTPELSRISTVEEIEESASDGPSQDAISNHHIVDLASDTLSDIADEIYVQLVSSGDEDDVRESGRRQRSRLSHERRHYEPDDDVDGSMLDADKYDQKTTSHTRANAERITSRTNQRSSSGRPIGFRYTLHKDASHHQIFSPIVNTDSSDDEHYEIASSPILGSNRHNNHNDSAYSPRNKKAASKRRKLNHGH